MIQTEELKRVPIFACLTDAQRERIAQNAAELYVQPGEWLIHEGEPPWFFVLLEGCLEAEKEYAGSRQPGRARYEPGDFYGETPILLDAPTIASLRAHEPSRVLRLDRLQFKELIDASPECSNLIVQVMMRRVTMIRDYMRDNNPLRVVVTGPANDAACREIRVFLSLNRIPFEWVDRDLTPDRVAICVPGAPSGSFVVVDQSIFVCEPLTVRKVADALGLSTAPQKDTYDVVVIGGGPAGLAAAVYGASEGLEVLLIERNAAGGQAGTSSRIENYLGFPSGISGDELSARAQRQALRFGAEIVLTREVSDVLPDSFGYLVKLDGDLSVKTKTIVVATGVEWRRLTADGLDSFQGRGVLYGAARTEASSVVGKTVFIVGGGNSAGQAAMFFSSYAASVTLLVRGPGLEATMSQYLIEQLSQKRNISVQPNTEVQAVGGSEVLETITTMTAGGSPVQRFADALFAMIGAKATTDWLPAALERDGNGFILTGHDIQAENLTRPPFLLETNLPGIFCAGDVRHNSIKRVSSGVGEGSMAIAFIHQYLALSTNADEAST